MPTPSEITPPQQLSALQLRLANPYLSALCPPVSPSNGHGCPRHRVCACLHAGRAARRPATHDGRPDRQRTHHPLGTGAQSVSLFSQSSSSSSSLSPASPCRHRRRAVDVVVIVFVIVVVIAVVVDDGDVVAIRSWVLSS